MRLQITKSTNAECFYVVKSVYENKKRTNVVVEKLGNLNDVKLRAGDQNILRKLALQMLKTCDTCKCGMRSKRKLCGLGIPTALQVLGLVPTGLLIP